MESHKLSYQDLLELQRIAYEGRPKRRLPVEKFLSGTQLESSILTEHNKELQLQYCYIKNEKISGYTSI